MEEFPDGFDLAALLAPVPGASPAGTDLRTDSSPQALYMRLRDARAEARAAERALDAEDAETAAGVPPQWRTIRELAGAALDQSKDLEVAAWLTEALLRSDGLIGLAAGARLMAGLVDGFWDALFPLPDEDGMATRVAPVAGLNGLSGDGTLIQPLRKITLFVRPPDGTPFQFWQYEQSAALAGIADAARRQQRIEAGVLPFETVEDKAHAAGGAHFARLRRHATAAAAAWQALSDTLDSHAGNEAPPTGRVRDLLAQMMEVAGRFAGPEEAAAAEPSPSPVVGVTPLAATGAVGSREEALRALAAIADYFRRTEPLSPLAYTLQEAVRRARLSWPELLEEIVPDAAIRGAILTSLGIRPPPTE